MNVKDEKENEILKYELDDLEEKKIFDDQPVILGAKPSKDSAIKLLVKWKKKKDIEFFHSTTLAKIYPQSVLNFYEQYVEKETMEIEQLQTIFGDEVYEVSQLSKTGVKNIKKILTAYLSNSQSYFVILFNNDTRGIVQCELLKKVGPHLVLNFYEKNFKWLD